MHYFFRKLQLITVLLLIRNSYTGWSTWFISQKLCVGFSIFDFISFFNFIFLFNKRHSLWLQSVIIPSEMKITEKVTHSFALRLLHFKLHQEVWKLDLATKFLGLENRSFKYVTFSRIFDIHVLNNLFIYFLNLFL